MPLPPTTSQQPYNWWSSRDGQPIVAIVAHNTVGWDSRAYLSRGGDLPDGSDKKVSIHYLIPKSGDKIYAYVPEERGANHAGFGTMPAGFPQVNPNKVTVSVELENASNGEIGPKLVVDPYPDVQLLAMGWLINDIRRRRGHLPILLHRTLDPIRRKDPVGLTVTDLEAWCVRAAAPIAYTPGRYRVRGVPIHEAPELASHIALGGTAFLQSGEVVDIDKIMPDGTTGHLLDGRGFVRLEQFEPL